MIAGRHTHTHTHTQTDRQTDRQTRSSLDLDQPNSRFHGRDIFRKIGLLPRKNAYFRKIRDFFVNFNAFTFIYEGFRVLSAAFEPNSDA